MLIHNAKQAKGFTIGGKARGLFLLQQAGYRVPDFALLPAETFDGLLQKQPRGIAGVSARRQALLQFRLSAEDKIAVRHLLHRWGFPEQAVVVRSSVAGEDGTQDSFAGMMDSFLHLISFADVLEAIAACAASAYGDRAMAYRRQKGLSLEARPAVILQKQVTPLASGVLFTTFPEYPQELALHAVSGFGEGLVGGSLVPHEFYFLKSTGQLHRQVLPKDATGQPTAACLSEPVLQALYEMGADMEKKFGCPQDIEFVVSACLDFIFEGEKEELSGSGEAPFERNSSAIALKRAEARFWKLPFAGQKIKSKQALSAAGVFLVQARPITQAIPPVVVYDNSNIQESYCGVTTPLTYSFATRAYATVYRQTMQLLAMPERVIREHEPVLANLLGLVKGRIYYNVNNWYRGLLLLPSFRQNKADMERMMGLTAPVDFVQTRKRPFLQQLRLLPLLAANLLRLLWAFSRLPQRVAAFQAHFRRHYLAFYRQAPAALGAGELLEQKLLLDRELLQCWTTPILNDFYVMMTNGRVQRKLRQAGIARPDAFLSRYLSGDRHIASTQPARAMLQLALQAWQQPGLQELIRDLPHDLHARVAKCCPAFHAGVNEFIAQYGDRTVGELKLETVTMRLEPLIFYRYLRNYLEMDTPPAPGVQENPALHVEAAAALRRLLSRRSVFFRKSVWRSLAKLQQAIRYRELMRLERTRLFGMYRALYLAIGRQLVQKGQLQQQRDVFYLSEQEIAAALSNTAPAGLCLLARNRQMEFDAYKQEEVPGRVVVPSPPECGKEQVRDNKVLQGTGCFQGLVTGQVVVVTDPQEGLEVSGKIVCALRTDPGWAVLFPTCRAVLIEKGSSLSHSVILLRELGIPTVINIPQLTNRLQTGQQVMLNGATGEITVLDR